MKQSASETRMKIKAFLGGTGASALKDLKN